MYLKTRQEQEEIRNAYPDKNHCDLLLHDNRACLGCTKNPNEGKNEAWSDIVTQNATALDWLLGMARGVRHGLISAAQLDSRSGHLVEAALDYLEREHDKRLAKLIGNEVALIMVRVLNARG